MQSEGQKMFVRNWKITNKKSPFSSRRGIYWS